MVQYKADMIIISLKINMFLPWYSWKIAELALKNNHSHDNIILIWSIVMKVLCYVNICQSKLTFDVDLFFIFSFQSCTTLFVKMCIFQRFFQLWGNWHTCALIVELLIIIIFFFFDEMIWTYHRGHTYWKQIN